MGIETLAFAALTTLSAVSSMKQANAQAVATITNTNIENENTVKTTNLNADSVKASFLNSGFGFTGTPELAVNDVFNTGMTNIKNNINSGNTTASNQVAAGRAAAIKTIAASAGLAAAGGSAGSLFDSGTALGNLVTTNSAQVIDNAAVDVSKNWVTGEQMVNY